MPVQNSGKHLSAKVAPMETSSSGSTFTNTSSSQPSSSSRCSSSASFPPLKERPNGLSYAEILVSFLKGMIGPGCLSLPLAFKEAGLLTGLGLVFLFGILNCICMLKLVKCSQLHSKRKGDTFLDYGNMAHEAVCHTFGPIQRFAGAAKFIVNTSIISLQMGICSVFYVFCAVHIKEFFDEMCLLPAEFKPTAVHWMLLLFPAFVLLNFVRALRPIAVFSSIGNLLCLCSLLFIFQHLLRVEAKSLALPWFTNFNGLMTACGSILYSFEGQAMVLPLENRLRRPHQMAGPLGVLSVGISVVSLVYAASGFLGYVAYGQAVRGSITLNLPQEDIRFSLLRLALTLVIYLGFLIQMFVIVEMLWPKLWKRLERMPKLQEYKLKIELLFRTLLVAVAMLFAIAVPNLEQIIPLVGVTTGMLLAFILPALLDMLSWLPILRQKSAHFRFFLLLLEDSFFAGISLFGLIAGLKANLWPSE